MMRNHNTTKLFYEYRALLTLKSLFPDDFQNAVHADKPDIIVSDRYGVEITRATNELAEMKKAYYQKYLRGKNLADLSDDVIARFENGGYGLVSYREKIAGFIPPAIWRNTDAIVTAIKKKMDLIQERAYSKFDRVDLYVFSDLFEDYGKNAVAEIVEKAAAYQSSTNLKITNLFFDDCGWFYKCDLTTSNINFYNTKGLLCDIDPLAKKMAE